MKLKDLVEQYGEYEVSDELIAQFKKPKPVTLWDLKEGDRYFVVYLTGEIGDIKFADCQNDCCVVSNGNAFLTKEEAEKDVERRKVETLLLKHGGRRWFKKDKENWFITFDNSVNLCFFKYTIRDPRQGMIYFDTEEELIEAVKAIGEYRIIKALFEVR